MNGLYDDAIRNRTDTTKRASVRIAFSAKQMPEGSELRILAAKAEGIVPAARIPGTR